MENKENGLILSNDLGRPVTLYGLGWSMSWTNLLFTSSPSHGGFSGGGGGGGWASDAGDEQPPGTPFPSLALLCLPFRCAKPSTQNPCRPAPLLSSSPTQAPRRASPSLLLRQRHIVLPLLLLTWSSRLRPTPAGVRLPRQRLAAPFFVGSGWGSAGASFPPPQTTVFFPPRWR